ncbi:vWA domain-containing protein [Abyssalbus ytuae]|uniref:VWA domain-containing protein n=1 Tax=Abyssalbus ytuae TaxID=2926907 RepID=A0A9E6ZN42_9FLAO|nr:vWA domain-containing protein [Abyssalbus ytuae]UOB18959.1 VWA domain-containing protein [Abyssalbus ytuae]
MKNLKHILSGVLIALVVINSYGCTKSNKNNISLFTNAINKPDRKYIKVALLLDTSNSMDGLINQAKAQLWDIVNELSYARCEHETPNLEIALYEYGNDNLPSSEGYIRQVIGFTNDLDEISEKLFSLTTNGGNEYCGQVIHTSLKQLEWGKNPDDLKLIFVAGNEPFTQGKINYKDAAADAKEKGIVVNTIFCGGYEQGISGKWKDGAIITGGDYMSIDHNQEIVQIVTPYDNTIIILNEKLNKTYIPYGSMGYSKLSMQREQDANAASVNEEIQLKRAVSKSSKMYKNSSWDLVDAAEDENFNYDSLKKDQLPASLQGKSTTEIKAYVKKQSEDRELIRRQIQELNKKRNKYIAEENKKATSNGLESAMINAIKKQAEKKDYKWVRQ